MRKRNLIRKNFKKKLIVSTLLFGLFVFIILGCMVLRFSHSDMTDLKFLIEYWKLLIPGSVICISCIIGIKNNIQEVSSI